METQSSLFSLSSVPGNKAQLRNRLNFLTQFVMIRNYKSFRKFDETRYSIYPSNSHSNDCNLLEGLEFSEWIWNARTKQEAFALVVFLIETYTSFASYIYTRSESVPLGHTIYQKPRTFSQRFMLVQPRCNYVTRIY